MKSMKKLTYKPLDFEQRSPEWNAWRKLGIGASEASVIMGSLPFEYEDILDLWKKKAGLPVPEFVVTPAIQFGIDTEDEALAKFIEATGVEMAPKCYSHPEHKFIRASLDGISEDGKQAVEIKCPSLSKFTTAKNGEILDYYLTQLQQQMACAGLDESFYWVYRPNKGGVLFKVYRSEDYIQELIRRESIFWEMVEKKEPCLPRHLGINPLQKSDPVLIETVKYEQIGFYES